MISFRLTFLTLYLSPCHDTKHSVKTNNRVNRFHSKMPLLHSAHILYPASILAQSPWYRCAKELSSLALNWSRARDFRASSCSFNGHELGSVFSVSFLNWTPSGAKYSRFVSVCVVVENCENSKRFVLRRFAFPGHCCMRAAIVWHSTFGFAK